MKNIFIINGHEKYGAKEGRLNRTLVDYMVTVLSEKHHVKTTTVQDGYSIKEEQEKFLWADVVIYQTPIYWFSVPGLFKTYMDEVYEYGLFFKGADEYGTGGLLKEKQYMFSTTWNAPEKAFGDKTKFFEGESLESALSHLHRVQKFLGMSPLKSFACYDVVKHPTVEKYLENLRDHLDGVIK
ncbi:NAD(P)H-dependent oxidoreductase [Bacillus wiedmannii]|uniref:Flavodoxin n=1 Tax=Bacillus wiedmannii TaxID=1890302 RepID=A0ABD6TIN5_9BACI|nr:NAD(P)H-dependent oxidoreductase [Bacillus wiedmannii]PEG08149.1 flavodoxin [Bacillus wiedmannii]PEI70578.1 flavodoxin [Bacillus wiedmannii]PEL41349.1 flavodoxin [Bacillus wiedmannii]PEN50455.1 flavodoxin [Bacillus wiedmannii]PEN61161.1 flavodoxin [Bacillus wiedmannii]